LVGRYAGGLRLVLSVLRNHHEVLTKNSKPQALAFRPEIGLPNGNDSSTNIKRRADCALKPVEEHRVSGPLKQEASRKSSLGTLAFHGGEHVRMLIRTGKRTPWGTPILWDGKREILDCSFRGPVLLNRSRRWKEAVTYHQARHASPSTRPVR
jgi:hypothetical protein